VLTATGLWLFDFQARMRAVWRHDVFRRRVIRQKNGADTLYTLHTSRSCMTSSSVIACCWMLLGCGKRRFSMARFTSIA